MTEFQNKEKVLLSYLCDRYKIEKDSPIYQAAYMVLQKLWQGSICISLEELEQNIQGLTENCILNSPCAGNENEKKPLVFDGENLYIQRYFVYQKIIINKIESLAENGRLHIITGGPGTGKTTSLSDILKNELDKKILLAAPTGKAAFRMTESLAKQGINIEAKTIHRLLGSIHLSADFRHNRENPIDADIIAIDECSMIDIPLMAKLLDAIPDNCRFYLLGDKNQLSPVEAGTVFADICRKYWKLRCKYKDNKNVYKELTKIYRTDSVEIIEFSKEVLNRKLPEFKYESIKYNEKLSFDELLNNYDALLNADNENDALKALHIFQILCAVKNGNNGTININKELTSRAKKRNAKYTPVIIIENNYTQKLFNGDVGVMDNETAYFSGDKEIRKFPLSALPAYNEAFAITIHKSQGSEYNSVAVVYPESERDDDTQTIFTRELLYTAVTRAKNKCLVFGSKEVLQKSCERGIKRISGIK